MVNKQDVTKLIFFVAMGYGKSACNGVERVLKHEASLHNLKSSDLKAIKSGDDFSRLVVPKVPGIVLLKSEAVYLAQYCDTTKIYLF